MSMLTPPVLAQSALERAQHAILGRLTLATFDNVQNGVDLLCSA
jgi:hypothetical protein